jgi:delta 1-pyrroline-5-carboxylate dehydrogenase
MSGARRITYTTIGSSEDFHHDFEKAIVDIKPGFGKLRPNMIAGVTYVNRGAGATTGAWPGVNPFGGWKAPGSTGPAALGPYYLLKFLREQSRAINP